MMDRGSEKGLLDRDPLAPLRLGLLQPDLQDAEGITWVLKNYMTAMDPTLTYEDLPNLSARLKRLPAGWKLWTKTLEEDLVLTPLGSERADHVG